MRIEQKSTFRRSYRKLHQNQRQTVDDAIRAVFKTPTIGEEKRGDLKGVWVYKFDCVNQLYLLAYECSDNVLLLLGLGPHEKFYRDLKRD
ncbi:MAG: type II toxin-antitoxin system RelE/ParE family toxin [Methylococcales bacterium]